MMFYKISNEELLRNIYKSLESFDERTQTIIVKKTADGVYYPAFAARSHGIKSYLELLTGFTTTSKVNKCLLNFILENEEQFLNCALNIEPIIRNFVKYNKITPEIKNVLNTLNLVATRHLKVTTDALERAQLLSENARIKTKTTITSAEQIATKIIATAKNEADALKETHQALIKGVEINPLAKRIRATPGDFLLICSDGIVEAHKLILGAYEKSVFKLALRDQDQKKSTFDLKTYSKATVNLCMDLLYGYVSLKEVSINTLIELYALADYLNLEELIIICENSILDYTEENSDTAFDLLEAFWEGEAIGAFPEMEESFYNALTDQLLESVIKGETKASDVIDLLSKTNYPIYFSTESYLLKGFNFEDFNNLSENQKCNLLKFTKGANPNHIDFVEIMELLCEEKLKLEPSLIELMNGLQYFYGYRAEKSQNHGKKLIENALEGQIEIKNLPGSIIALIGIYYDREEREKEAFELYELAAKKGAAYGLTYLAKCYHFGIGTAQDISVAKHYYTLAAKKGIRLALIKLGLIETDKTLAGKYFRKALNSNDPHHRSSALFEAGKFFYALPDPAVKQEGLNYLLEAATKEQSQDAITFMKDNNIIS